MATPERTIRTPLEHEAHDRPRNGDNGTVSEERAIRKKGSKRTLLVAAGVVAAIVVIGIVLVLTGVVGGGGSARSGSQPGVPREVSVQEVRDFAVARPRPTYWAGDLPGRRIELTEAGRDNVYVRYLTGDAVVGDGRPAFTTVGTYPLEGAYREVERRSKARDQEAKPAPGGGLATWSAKRPSSVYVGYPGSDQLVEVYDPDPQRARELALSGEVGPVR